MSRTSDGLKRHPSQWGVADAQPSRSHAVFLRAIAHVPIQPFRDGLEELGLRDVTSFGATGNLMFNTDVEDMRLLEEAITGRLGAVAFVRRASSWLRSSQPTLTATSRVPPLRC